MQHTSQCSKSTNSEKESNIHQDSMSQHQLQYRFPLRTGFARGRSMSDQRPHRDLQKLGNSENEQRYLCQRQPPASLPWDRSAALPLCRVEAPCFLASSWELWVMCGNRPFCSGLSKASSILSQVQKGQQ